MAITHTVGKNGVNNALDVVVVQKLLDENLHLLIPFDQLGAVDPGNAQQLDELIKRIETFQRRVIPLSAVDGRVDPGSKTLDRMEANATVARKKGLSGKAKIPLYPFPRLSEHDPETGARFFGANRSGNRKHAGIDLKFPVGTPIRAMADGKILLPTTPFYEGTNYLVVDHGIFIARYGEISHVAPGFDRIGATVKRGQIIAFVGRLNSGNSMLHLELYSGSETGDLTQRGKPPFQRRGDLLSPMEFIKSATLNDEPGQDDYNARVSNRVASVIKVRSKQQLSAPVVAKLSPGSWLDILSEVTGDSYETGDGNDNRWFEVDIDGTHGFAAAFYIARVSTQAPRPQGNLSPNSSLDAIGKYGKVSSRAHTPVNLRSSADPSSGVKAKLEPGTLLELKQKLTGGSYPADDNNRTDWLEVEIKNGEHQIKTGFIAGFYVDPVLRTGRTSEKVTTDLTMRELPEKNATPITSLMPGTTFTVIRGTTGGTYQDATGANHNEWLDIEHDSKRGFVAAAFAELLDPVTQTDDLNAILFTYEPKGASDLTARQDNLPAQGIVGVKASEAMAESDRKRIKALKVKFIEAGKPSSLPPALLAAIASRETRCGNVLDNEGFGDHHNAFGIMQVDKRFHSPVETDDGPTGEAHIHQATGILREKLDGVNRNFEGLSDSQSLQTAVSRYNGGKKLPAPHSDEGTTGGDYMNDVWARARYYAKVETWP